jgi:hypothetical protein
MITHKSHKIITSYLKIYISSIYHIDVINIQQKQINDNVSYIITLKNNIMLKLYYDINTNSYIVISINSKIKTKHIIPRIISTCVIPFVITDIYTNDTHINIIKKTISFYTNLDELKYNKHINILKQMLHISIHILVDDRLNEINNIFNKTNNKCNYTFKDLKYKTLNGDIFNFNLSMN